MELIDIKSQIDNYFNKISHDEIIKIFEDMGCEFIDIDSEYVDIVNEYFWELI